MAATRISNASAIAACDAIVDKVDQGAGAGYVEIRSGTQPADPDTAAGGTVLATITLQDPAFGGATDAAPGGQAAINGTPSDASADATGTAAWFRVYDSNNVALWDGDCSGTGGGGDMELDNTSIASGQPVTINTWTVTMPET